MDCVLISLTPSVPTDNRYTQEYILRFPGDARRMNVMLSRAEAHLHGVRDIEYIANSGTKWDEWWYSLQDRHADWAGLIHIGNASVEGTNRRNNTF